MRGAANKHGDHGGPDRVWLSSDFLDNTNDSNDAPRGSRARREVNRCPSLITTARSGNVFRASIPKGNHKMPAS